MDKSLFTRLTPLELSVKQSEELEEDRVKVKKELDESIRELELTSSFRDGLVTGLVLYTGYDQYEASVEAQTFLEDNLDSSRIFFRAKD